MGYVQSFKYCTSHYKFTYYDMISHEGCTQFLHFFLTKVNNIWAQISASVTEMFLRPCSLRSFNHFDLITLSILEDVISALRPSGSPIDPVPTRFIKEVYPNVGPRILQNINSCLASSIVQHAFKHAVVQLILKKTGLDPNNFGNLRPISKPPFLSKVIFDQISSYLSDICVVGPFQSGFHPFHSTCWICLELLIWFIILSSCLVRTKK